MEKIISVLILLLFCSQLIHSKITPPFRFRIVTWNVGSSEPDCETFEQLAFSSTSNNIKADLIVFGFQEAAKKIFGSNSFHKTLKKCLQSNHYTMILSDYVGSDLIKPIWLYMFVSTTMLQSQRVNLLKINTELTMKVYQDKFFENIIGYKGIIASRLQIDNITNMIFANMHLPAGEGKIVERCKLLTKFLHTYLRNSVQDDYMFVFGDQNWRTINTMSIDNILQAIQTKNYQSILNNDELTRMRQYNDTTQCLKTFYEAPITFPPTYKYFVNTDTYQTQRNYEDRRPSYTDRILLSNLSKDIRLIQYSAMNDIKISDHRPVFADFHLHRSTNKNKSVKKSNFVNHN
ncbi:hypothetical protein I4U23_026534 [Adineta vaga]|nr:hypothetical protein I4U23_026534 [Adineta vaga]